MTIKFLLISEALLFNLKDSNYLIYAGLFITYQSSWNDVLPSSYTNQFALFKININSKENFKSSPIYSLVSEKFTAYGKMVSCFQTENKIIVCFYISSLSDKGYKIITFDENFQIVNQDFIVSVIYMDENIFFKCIHYEEEIGAFYILILRMIIFAHLYIFIILNQF